MRQGRKRRWAGEVMRNRRERQARRLKSPSANTQVRIPPRTNNKVEYPSTNTQGTSSGLARPTLEGSGQGALAFSAAGSQGSYSGSPAKAQRVPGQTVSEAMWDGADRSL